MIRVCHVITELALGGAQQNTLYTVAHLDRRRFDPVLLAGRGGLLDDEARASGAPVIFVDALRRNVAPVRDAAALVALWRHFRRLRPAIVHTHSSKAGILGRWAARLAGVPLIVHTIHGYGFHPGQSRLARGAWVMLERITGRFCTSAFIAVSRANLIEGMALGILSKQRASLIHSGIRLADFEAPPACGSKSEAPASKSEAPAPGEAPVTVGMVACLKPQKAPLDFVRAAAKVARLCGRDRVRFVLLGDGVLRQKVEEAIRSEGMTDLIALPGWCRDIPGAMREFDILLHTSRWEGLPRVFPEAMATGLPIVATDVDGAPEAIEDGATGYLLPTGDVEGLARRTAELVMDPGLRRAMGERARAKVSAWDIDDMVRRQERLYEGLVAGPASAAVSRSTQGELV